jgi:hypothetical protein
MRVTINNHKKVPGKPSLERLIHLFPGGYNVRKSPLDSKHSNPPVKKDFLPMNA